jgi:hypothetical protein
MARCLRCGAGNEWIEGSRRIAPVDDDNYARLLAVKQAAEPALIELMYLIEQAKCREGGSVVRAYENLRAALAAEAGE